MTNDKRPTIHTYEVGVTLRLDHGEKSELAAFLLELSKRRDDREPFSRVFGAHGGFVLNLKRVDTVEHLSPEVIRELAGNYSLHAGERVVGHAEEFI